MQQSEHSPEPKPEKEQEIARSIHNLAEISVSRTEIARTLCGELLRAKRSGEDNLAYRAGAALGRVGDAMVTDLLIEVILDSDLRSDQPQRDCRDELLLIAGIDFAKFDAAYKAMIGFLAEATGLRDMVVLVENKHGQAQPTALTRDKMEIPEEIASELVNIHHRGLSRTIYAGSIHASDHEQRSQEYCFARIPLVSSEEDIGSIFLFSEKAVDVDVAKHYELYQSVAKIFGSKISSVKMRLKLDALQNDNDDPDL